MLRITLPLVFPLMLSACVRSSGPGITSKNGYTITRNLVYTPENWPEKVHGDLYQPKSLVASPAVLLIHGGGWTGSDGRWQMEPIAKKLVKRGYVVLNVTYRLAPAYIYPAPVDDMQEAVKWLRAHAVEKGIDPERIATFGYSAGAYLAAFTGLIEGRENSHIKAVVAGGMPSDLTFYPGGDLVPQFLGGTKQQIPERFREASPVNYITSNSPPMYVYHGGADTLVPPEHAWATIHALEKNKVPHEIYWIEGRNHVPAYLFPASAIEKSIDFLDRWMR